jgi:hypothetical protein
MKRIIHAVMATLNVREISSRYGEGAWARWYLYHHI